MTNLPLEEERKFNIKNNEKQKDVRGRLGLRHHRSKRQTDEHPGVYRHASAGAGLRDGREPQALTHQQPRLTGDPVALANRQAAQNL